MPPYEKYISTSLNGTQWRNTDALPTRNEEEVKEEEEEEEASTKKKQEKKRQPTTDCVCTEHISNLQRNISVSVLEQIYYIRCAMYRV